MANNAKIGLGTIVKRGDGASPEVFTKVPECIAFPSSLGETQPLVDVSYSDATAMEYIAGMADGSEMEFTFNYYDHAQQAAMITDFKNKTNRNYQVVIAPSTLNKTLAFTLTPIEWRLEPNFKEQVKFVFKGKVSGSVTIT